MARKSGTMSKQRRKASDYMVFISHATADKWLATMLCQKIESIGAKTFRDDRDINGGDDIPDSLRTAISRSDEMVVLLTPESVNRPWVLMEVGAAWQRGPEVRIVGVKQHVSIEPIPDMLKSKKIIDLNEFDQYLKDLSERVRARA